MDVEICDDVVGVFRLLGERLDMLNNHLGKYRLSLFHKSKGNIHFDLINVSRIIFTSDGFEIILNDSNTIYLQYCLFEDVSLLRLDTLTE